MARWRFRSPHYGIGRADAGAANILWNIRMPRVVLAGLVGASLAIAGAAFQGLLKNPLADPYTLGVSSGASVGAVITLFFGISIPFLGIFTLPVFSMIGAFVTMLRVIGFAKLVDRSMKMETIILTGIIFSSFLGSVISLMIALTGEELRQIIGWLLGSVSMRGWDYVNMALPFIIIGSILMWLNRRELNAMLFGEERAKHLGVNVKQRKMMILIGGSMVTGAAVAVSGTIGFVGSCRPAYDPLIVGGGSSSRIAVIIYKRAHCSSFVISSPEQSFHQLNCQSVSSRHLSVHQYSHLFSSINDEQEGCKMLHIEQLSGGYHGSPCCERRFV